MKKVVSPSVQDFLADVRAHEMLIFRDDAVYRHLRFKRPDTNCYYFDLITWPGHLCITGDMQSFVFMHTNDMFEFFQAGLSDKPLNINPDYWAQKLIATAATGRNDGQCMEFSHGMFTYHVREHWKDFCRSEDLPFTAAESLWEEIERELLHTADPDEYSAHRAARDFESEEQPKFNFSDFWETDLRVYTHHFIWCCYAVLWGIKKFEEWKASNADSLETTQ